MTQLTINLPDNGAIQKYGTSDYGHSLKALAVYRIIAQKGKIRTAALIIP